MPKSASISMVRRWIRENIAIPKQAPPSAYWQLGKRVADIRARHNASWRDLAAKLGIGEATLRQAKNFATRFKKKEAVALDRAGAGWRAVLPLVGRKDKEKRLQLLAEMPGLIAKAKQRGVPQLDIVKEFIAENFGQEADPKTPARLPDVLAKMQDATARIVPIFGTMWAEASTNFASKDWRKVAITRQAIALAETLDEASVLIRSAYLDVYQQMDKEKRRQRIDKLGDWFVEELIEDAEWVEKRLATLFCGKPTAWDEIQAGWFGIDDVDEFRRIRQAAREASEYFIAQADCDRDVADMLSSDGKVGKPYRAAAWTIAERDSCCKPRRDGTTIASDFCKKNCYCGPEFEGRLCRGRGGKPDKNPKGLAAKTVRNAQLRHRRDFAKLMIGCLSNERVRLLRIHINGDFDTPKYMKAWLDIVRGYPWADFLVFTRAWRAPELVPYVRQLAALPNAYVHLSYDESAHDTPVIPNAWTTPLLDSRDNPPPLKPKTDRVAFRVREPFTHKRYKRRFADEANRITPVCPRESGYFKCDYGSPKKGRKPKKPDTRRTAKTCYFCRICLQHRAGRSGVGQSSKGTRASARPSRFAQIWAELTS